MKPHHPVPVNQVGRLHFLHFFLFLSFWHQIGCTPTNEPEEFYEYEVDDYNSHRICNECISTTMDGLFDMTKKKEFFEELKIQCDNYIAWDKSISLEKTCVPMVLQTLGSRRKTFFNSRPEILCQWQDACSLKKCGSCASDSITFLRCLPLMKKCKKRCGDVEKISSRIDCLWCLSPQFMECHSCFCEFLHICSSLKQN
eukprot:TRINITY_DN1708_c0_g1_i1.p1 TRINITY_DN1708_c0_g1~~TRINITY_DN1708_c0_g1_i1.p1  ORF type:complete len:199 (-),score=21.54 TRINITY_DN1708_c0_g1_i1:178-774(-)